MHHPGIALLALFALTLALALPATALAQCSYDFDWSHLSNGKVRVRVTVSNCGGSVYRTTLSADGSFDSRYGNLAQVDIDDPAGDQLYCANASASYWNGPYLALDEGASECQTW